VSFVGKVSGREGSGTKKGVGERLVEKKGVGVSF
jgi:hypothetical protein